MSISSSLRITALGLACSSVAFAQGTVAAPPAPAPVAPSAAAAPPPAPRQLSMVTESSRVRAFSAGPGGEVRSVYLQNGSVVDLAPGLGRQFGPSLRKGAKITVTGTRSEINGQSLVEAASVRLNDQTFSANVPAPGPIAVVAAPPPPPGAPQAPPAPGPRRGEMGPVLAPNAATRNAPPPPAGPDGPPPPPRGFAAVPPPPPPTGAAAPPPLNGSTPPPSPAQN